MRQIMLAYWRAIPAGLRAKLMMGIVGSYLVLVPIMGIGQLRSTQKLNNIKVQNETLEKDLGTFSERLDELVEDGSSSTVTHELRALRDEVIKYRAEQQGRDQILGIQYDSVISDPLDSITRSLMTLEEMNASSSANTSALSQPNTSPIPPNGAMLGTVTLHKDKGWSSVDAFESPLASAKIVGQLVVNVSYPFYERRSGWYQAELASGKRGWVQAQFVQEE